MDHGGNRQHKIVGKRQWQGGEGSDGKGCVSRESKKFRKCRK
jgi:hypothetical protein